MTSNQDSSPHYDLEEQRLARDAVMAIPPFPELQARLTRVFGPGGERDMIHQLVYWFSKPKMQNRWTLYKTFEEWRDERGLNRKQVDKARARLRVHPAGVLTETRGQYGRIHYRLDWVALADLLNLTPLKGVQIDDLNPEFNLTPLKGERIQSDPPLGGTPNLTPLKGVQPNTGEYAGEYEQENSVLHTGAEPAFAEPAPQERNGKEHNHPPQQELTRLDFDTVQQAESLLLAEPGVEDEKKLARLLMRCREREKGVDGRESFTVGYVAEELREEVGGSEPLRLYEEVVERCLATE